MSCNLSLAALPLLALSLVSGCASNDVDDELLADSSDEAGLDGKADSVDGAYTYYAIARDMRRCASPYCGGFQLARVNRTTTKCHDSTFAERCYTPELDWSESGLDEAQQEKLVGMSGKLGGRFAVVRGRFVKKNLGTPVPSRARRLGRAVRVHAAAVPAPAPQPGADRAARRHRAGQLRLSRTAGSTALPPCRGRAPASSPGTDRSTREPGRFVPRH